MCRFVLKINYLFSTLFLILITSLAIVCAQSAYLLGGWSSYNTKGNFMGLNFACKIFLAGILC